MHLIFPKNFFWGAATSSHQIEGNLTNDWSEWEISTDRIAALRNAGKDPERFISGRNSDSYGNNNANIACLRELGANSYRWSLEWSRIEPREGEFQEDVLEHYRDFCKKLRAHGIEPFVTIWHWTNPLWIRDMGGWESKKVLPYFERFVEKVANYLGEEVTFWITINEPQVFSSMSYLNGEWPPQKKNPLSYLRVLNNLNVAHKRAYDVLKKINPQNQVGLASHNIYFEPKHNSLMNRLIANGFDWWWNDHFLDRLKAHQDFIGLNYYFHSVVHYGKKEEHPYERYSDLAWGLYPEGIYHVLKSLKKYNKPIYITEAGLADKDDAHRAWYIKELLAQLHKAIDDDVDVRGFFYWSLIDNFEWAYGFEPCFGLYAVDYQSLERSPRPSATYYQSVIARNGVNIEGED